MADDCGAFVSAVSSLLIERELCALISILEVLHTDGWSGRAGWSDGSAEELKKRRETMPRAASVAEASGSSGRSRASAHIFSQMNKSK